MEEFGLVMIIKFFFEVDVEGEDVYVVVIDFFCYSFFKEVDEDIFNVIKSFVIYNKGMFWIVFE